MLYAWYLNCTQFRASNTFGISIMQPRRLIYWISLPGQLLRWIADRLTSLPRTLLHSFLEKHFWQKRFHRFIDVFHSSEHFYHTNWQEGYSHIALKLISASHWNKIDYFPILERRIFPVRTATLWFHTGFHIGLQSRCSMCRITTFLHTELPSNYPCFASSMHSYHQPRKFTDSEIFKVLAAHSLPYSCSKYSSIAIMFQLL